MPRLVDDTMCVPLLALIVTAPKVSVDIGTLYDVISYHLSTCGYVAWAHYIGADIFSASLIETEDPYVGLDAAFCVVREARLVNFHGTAEIAHLMRPVVVLEVLMDQLSHSLV